MIIFIVLGLELLFRLKILLNKCILLIGWLVLCSSVDSVVCLCGVSDSGLFDSRNVLCLVLNFSGL